MCCSPQLAHAHPPMPIYSRQEEKASGQLIHILHSYKWVDADEIVEILVVPKNWEIL